MKAQEFEQVVSAVLDGLPPDFAEKLEEGNVGVVVRARPTPEELEALGARKGTTLLGLYHGVPPAKRGYHYSLVLPDTITIYREPILGFCTQTGRPVPDMIREVVLHEIAHHFGISDARLRELGY
ncbi:MAG: metallopeptidase family protein [Actinomycetota bacterium]